jgi:PAS domain S-box-containing protein
MTELGTTLAGDGVTLREIADALPDAAFALDADGALQWWNDRFEELTSFDADELAGRTLADVVIDREAVRVRDKLDTVREHGGTATPRTHVVTAAGDPVSVQLRVSRLGDDQPSVLVGVVHAVTEQRRVEADLGDALARVTDALLVLDADWRITYLNDAAADALGADLVGRCMWDAVPEAEDSRFGEECRAAVADGEAKRFETDCPAFPGRVEVRVFPSDSGVSVYVGDVSDDLRRERDIEIYERLVEAVGDAIYAVDEERRFVLVNERFAELAGVPKDRLLGEQITVLREEGALDASVYDAATEEMSAVFDGDADEARFEFTMKVEGEERVFEANAAELTASDDMACAVNVVRDVTERVRREREVAARRDELRTLNRINALIHEVIAAFVTAASREEIEETVCEHLQASVFYQSAWIGEPDPSGDGIAPRTGVGVSDQFLDQVPEMDASRSWDGPASQALETGEIQIIDDLLEADAVPEPVREAALARGVQSVVSVPLRYADTVYGFLTVGATRPDAFSEREQSAFEVLGEVIGFAINAVQSKQLLLADATTELEFEISDDRSVFVAASTAASCSLDLDGMVPVGDGTLLCYATVADASPEDVVDCLAEQSGVADARVVSERSDGSVLEFTLVGESVVHALTQRGAHVRSVSAEHGSATLTVAVAPSVDVRSLVERVQATFDLRLAAKQDVTESRQPAPNLRRALDDSLTDRQRAALHAAYHGGYFEWPRGSTAEELAEAMDISSPTFHQHLRAAQRKLLSAFLDAADTP